MTHASIEGGGVKLMILLRWPRLFFSHFFWSCLFSFLLVGAPWSVLCWGGGEHLVSSDEQTHGPEVASPQLTVPADAASALSLGGLPAEALGMIRLFLSEREQMRLFLCGDRELNRAFADSTHLLSRRRLRNDPPEAVPGFTVHQLILAKGSYLYSAVNLRLETAAQWSRFVRLMEEPDAAAFKALKIVQPPTAQYPATSDYSQLGHLSQFSLLDVSYNRIHTLAALKRLVAALVHPHNRVETLNLSGNVLGWPGAGHELAQVLRSPHNHLRVFDVSFNQLGEQGVADLAASFFGQPYNRLSELDLSGNGIDGAGAEKLAVGLSHGESSLSALVLSNNGLGDRGAQAMASALRHGSTKLASLDLSGNQIAEPGAKALAAALSAPVSATTAGGQRSGFNLNLDENEVGDEGAKSFAVALESANQRIEHLGLCSNDLSDEGAQRLAAALGNPHCQLRTLGLRYNQISDQGAAALAVALTSEHQRQHPLYLKELDLTGNEIGEEVRDLLQVAAGTRCHVIF